MGKIARQHYMVLDASQFGVTVGTNEYSKFFNICNSLFQGYLHFTPEETTPGESIHTCITYGHSAIPSQAISAATSGLNFNVMPLIVSCETSTYVSFINASPAYDYLKLKFPTSFVGDFANYKLVKEEMMPKLRNAGYLLYSPYTYDGEISVEKLYDTLPFNENVTIEFWLKDNNFEYLLGTFYLDGEYGYFDSGVRALIQTNAEYDLLLKLNFGENRVSENFHTTNSDSYITIETDTWGTTDVYFREENIDEDGYLTVTFKLSNIMFDDYDYQLFHEVTDVSIHWEWEEVSTPSNVELYVPFSYCYVSTAIGNSIFPYTSGDFYGLKNNTMNVTLYNKEDLSSEYYGTAIADGPDGFTLNIYNYNTFLNSMSTTNGQFWVECPVAFYYNGTRYSNLFIPLAFDSAGIYKMGSRQECQILMGNQSMSYRWDIELGTSTVGDGLKIYSGLRDDCADCEMLGYVYNQEMWNFEGVEGFYTNKIFIKPYYYNSNTVDITMTYSGSQYYSWRSGTVRKNIGSGAGFSLIPGYYSSSYVMTVAYFLRFWSLAGYSSGTLQDGTITLSVITQ